MQKRSSSRWVQWVVIVVMLSVGAWHSEAAAEPEYDGTWIGECPVGEVALSVEHSEETVSGVLSIDGVDYSVQGSAGADGLVLSGACAECADERRCELECTAAADAAVDCALRLTGRLGLVRKACSLSLVNAEKTLRLSLLMGHVQQPSNIYLFFSAETLSGAPLTSLVEDDFELYENDARISQYESLQTIIPNPTLYTMATVLLLDMSGSILESETLNPLKASAGTFLEKIAGDDGQEVAVYLFDGRAEPRQLIDFTRDTRALQNAIAAVSKSDLVSDPAYDVSTNLNGAVLDGLRVLDGKQAGTAEGQLFAGSLVVFTDGTDQADRVSDADSAAAVQATGHTCFTIGLGGEIDEGHLAALGRDGFAWAEDTAGLNEAFDAIAEDIRSESGKHYILGYCSPKRNGTHRVELRVAGFAGSITYPFVADDFTGGCDPLDILEGFEPGSGSCVLSVQPDTVRKIPLSPRLMMLTVRGAVDMFTRESRVAVSGAVVFPPLVRRPDRLIVPVWLPAALQPGALDVSVTTGTEVLTCYDLLTVR